jgi:murein DD-endopeptidase MepM/ murein hydrolase activator NlpD
MLVINKYLGKTPIAKDRSDKITKTHYSNVLEEAEYFPIPENLNTTGVTYSYIDSFGDPRTYGGDRQHQGIDIMDDSNTRGYFPIISVSKGEVENIGWIEKGGYRIGIRSESGYYYYYAHLSSYALDMEIGKQVVAGELLGFMGDTGYSEIEGTTGNFPVHLHFGICLKEDEWLNPYEILLELENRKLKTKY